MKPPARVSAKRFWVACFAAVSLGVQHRLLLCCCCIFFLMRSAGCAAYLVFALHFLSFHFDMSSSPPYISKNTPKWLASDTADWLRSQGFYAEANLFSASNIDGKSLLSLSEWDIGEVIGVKNAETRDVIYRNIVRLRSLNPDPVLPRSEPQKLALSVASINAPQLQPVVIKFYSSGTSFLEDPAFEMSNTDVDLARASLDDVKSWLKTRVGEPIESLKGREGFDILDIDTLKRSGKAYFLRSNEFYFLPIEKIGGFMDIFLSSQKREVRVEMLSTTPRLLLVKNFISLEECNKIIETARPRLEHSTVAVVKGGKQQSDQDNQVRTSSTAWLNSQTTGLRLLDDITRRVYELVKVPMDHAEDMQVLHYGFKQHYHAHHDFFDPNVYPTPEFKKGHNRMITVFMYLSDVEEGGETNFPFATGEKTLSSYDKCEMGLKVKPKRGDCIIFYSMKADAHRPQGNQLDTNSLHAGCDVLKGDKWSANYWIRNVPWRVGSP
jgi:prolyl 4-hydroxylase